MSNGSSIPSHADTHESSLSFDWALTLQLTGGKENLAQEILTIFMKQLPETQTLVNDSYTEKNYPTLQSHLHKLLGGCCYCGVPPLKAITAKFESAVRNEQVAELPQLLEEFNKEAGAVLEAYKNWKP